MGFYETGQNLKDGRLCESPNPIPKSIKGCKNKEHSNTAEMSK